MLSSFSEHLLRQSVVPRESTTPPDPTIAAHVASLPATPCDHLNDTTTRYDHAQKLLTFLLVCFVWGTEKIVDVQHYEPRFQSSGPPSSRTQGPPPRNSPSAETSGRMPRAA